MEGLKAASLALSTQPSPSPDPAQPSRHDELKSLLTGWRSRLEPDPKLGLNTGRRRGKVSQEEVARRMGVSSLYYGMLERADMTRNYSPDFLDKVAYTLELSTGERRMLYLLVLGYEPSPRALSHPVEISIALRATLEAQPWPAWVSDPGWEMLVTNEATLEWFPHIDWERNVMRWVFKYSQSREQLCDWETVWAPRMLGQMRAAYGIWPDNTALKELIAETKRINDFARQWWNSTAEVVMHPDGDQRELYVGRARAARTTVEIVASTPMRHPDLRLVQVVPVGGLIPPACQAAIGKGQGASA